MNVLEQRYRRALRLLPRTYRERWEEEMVATFLDQVSEEDGRDPENADYRADHGRPGRSEIAGIALLSVRLRLGTAGAPPRYRAWGAAIRRAVLCVLLARSVAGVVEVLAHLWSTGRLGLLPPPPEEIYGGPVASLPEAFAYVPLLCPRWLCAWPPAPSIC